MASNRQKIKEARERFSIAERLEKEYFRALNGLVKNIDSLVKSMVNVKMSESELRNAQSDLDRMLRGYSEMLKPWAKVTAEKMVQRIAKTDETAWIRLGKTLNKELKQELNSAPTGDLLQTFLSEQVRLITSLPLEAAERVHKMTLEGITTGERAADIAVKILETGDVTKSRATLIARTEVARTASGLTMARAKHIGSTHYYWRSSGDGDVREGHKEMNGKICEWANPPWVNEGTKEKPKMMQHHAGMIWNCRCYPEPILDID